jgi:hypothetical protein
MCIMSLLGVRYLFSKEISMCTENVMWVHLSLLGVRYLCSKEISMRTTSEAHRADG